MNVVLTEKERTALSILLGLRQKFTREANKDPQTYSSRDLSKLFTETMNKINKGELRYFDSMIQRLNERKKKKEKDHIWDLIDKQVERSTIKRYNWDKVFGTTLTKIILNKIKENLDAEEAYNSLEKDERVTDFIETMPREKKKILKNLKISVYARYGENRTAKKVREK